MQGVLALLPHGLAAAGAHLLGVLPGAGAARDHAAHVGGVGLRAVARHHEAAADHLPDADRGLEQRAAGVQAAVVSVDAAYGLVKGVPGGPRGERAPRQVALLAHGRVVVARARDAIDGDVEQRAAVGHLDHAHEALHGRGGRPGVRLQDGDRGGVGVARAPDDGVPAAPAQGRDDGGGRHGAVDAHDLLAQVEAQVMQAGQALQTGADLVGAALAVHLDRVGGLEGVVGRHWCVVLCVLCCWCAWMAYASRTLRLSMSRVVA